MPKTIAILTNTYKKIAVAKPKQYNFAKKLLDTSPTLIILYISNIYKNKSIIDPRNPNSSENSVNIKSVCFSGKKSK